MGRSPLTYLDYRKAAEEKNLEFIAPTVPSGVFVRTKWRCKLTGIVMTKSYLAVKNAEYGSRYQRTYPEMLERYHALADALGIEFLYEEGKDYFPATNKSPCKWRGQNGRVVEATYHQLAYGQIPQHLIEALGLAI